VRILGIDPGLVRTGWALVEPAGLRATVRDYGLIAPNTDLELPARLAEGARELRLVLERSQPQVVALEDVFTAPRHPKSALLMAHMRGVICLVVQEAGVPVLMPLTATTVKQRLTGNGHASKEQVQRMVERLTGVDVRGLRLDVTDAIGLALAALNQIIFHERISAAGSRGGAIDPRLLMAGRSKAAQRLPRGLATDV
jgi:crossover junction endodeoxyribonuclease RuvC